MMHNFLQVLDSAGGGGTYGKGRGAGTCVQSAAIDNQPAPGGVAPVVHGPTPPFPEHDNSLSFPLDPWV
jgi:hypothetical protein